MSSFVLRIWRVAVGNRQTEPECWSCQKQIVQPNRVLHTSVQYRHRRQIVPLCNRYHHQTHTKYRQNVTRALVRANKGKSMFIYQNQVVLYLSFLKTLIAFCQMCALRPFEKASGSLVAVAHSVKNPELSQASEADPY